MMTLKSIFDRVVSSIGFVVNVVPDWFWCVTMGNCMLSEITLENLQSKRKIFWFLVSLGLTFTLLCHWFE
jgi:hypothetical protein